MHYEAKIKIYLLKKLVLVTSLDKAVCKDFDPSIRSLRTSSGSVGFEGFWRYKSPLLSLSLEIVHGPPRDSDVVVRLSIG